MADFTIDAIYENGVLRPLSDLGLREGGITVYRFSSVMLGAKSPKDGRRENPDRDGAV